MIDLQTLYEYSGIAVGALSTFAYAVWRVWKKFSPYLARLLDLMKEEKKTDHGINVECSMCSKEKEMESLALQVGIMDKRMEKIEENQIKTREDVSWMRGLLEGIFEKRESRKGNRA